MALRAEDLRRRHRGSVPLDGTHYESRQRKLPITRHLRSAATADAVSGLSYTQRTPAGRSI